MVLANVVGFGVGVGAGLLGRPVLDSWLRWRVIKEARAESDARRAEVIELVPYDPDDEDEAWPTSSS